MQRCERCGEWFDRDLLVCPRCRAGVPSIVPLIRRRRTQLVFAVVLLGVTLVVLLLVRLCVRDAVRP
jgi:hypothetical protein